MESMENFLASCTLDEDVKQAQTAPEQEKKTEKQIESRLNKIKRDLEDKELRKKITKEKRKHQRAAKHKERVAFLSKMTIEERKEFIHKEKALDADLNKRMQEAKEKRTHDLFFDLSFTRYMKDKELNSLGSQLTRSMKVIKQSKDPFAIHLCSYNGKIKDVMDRMGCSNWIAYFHEEDLSELEELPENLLYLSPDAEEVLEDFDATTSFVIGGIVDRTVTSCTSLYKANSCGIKAVKLPLKETLTKTRKDALNINTVIEILTKYLETKDWSKTLSEALPERLIKSEVKEKPKEGSKEELKE